MKKQENVIKKFKKDCPKCSIEISYRYNYELINSINKNKLCSYCSRQETGKKNIGRVRDDNFKENLRIKMTNHPSIINNKDRGDKIKEKLLGRDVSGWHKGSQKQETTCILCNKIYLVIPSRLGFSHFCTRKCMISYYHSNKIWVPKYNPKACEIIDEYGLKEGYNFQHALNGGEFRFKDIKVWVDGYDKENNVVIEYNEKHHYLPKMILLDKIRRELIMKHLKCKFIIINYKNEIKIYE